MNNSNVSTPPPDITIPSAYVGLGVTTLVSNLIICLVLVRNVGFFKKSPFIVGLTAADLLFGSGVLFAGVLRIYYLNNNIANFAVHPLYCLQRYTSILMTSVELDSAVMFLIGSERLLAVAFFRWYYQKWTSRKAWMATFIMYIANVVFIGSAWITVTNFPSNTTTAIYCSTQLVVGDGFAFTTFGSGVVSGLWAIGTTLFALQSFLKKKKNALTGTDVNMKQFLKKQYRITVSSTCLAGLDFTLVVIPNLLILLSTYYPVLLPAGYVATCCMCIRATLSIFTYSIFNREFRSNLFATFHLKQNVVHTITIQQHQTTRY